MEVTCPSGLKGIIQKPKVRVLNEMRKKANSDQIKSFTYLLDQCWVKTVDLGPYRWDSETVPWHEVLSGDRFFLLLKIREAMHGSKYLFKVFCGNCRKKFEWVVEISELEIKALPEDAKKVFLREDKLFEKELSKGTKVRFKMLTGQIEQTLLNQKEEPILQKVMPRLVSIGEESHPAKLREMLLDMDPDEYDELMAELKKYDCGVETEIDVVCERCNQYKEIDLPFGQGFFFPRSGA